VASQATGQILRFDGVTGGFVGVFATVADPGLMGKILFGADGDLYVSSITTHEVLRYDGATGDSKGVFVAARSGGLALPLGMEFTPDVLRGGTVGLQKVTRVVCSNLNSGQKVTIRPQEATWDCQAAGLSANTGETVAMQIEGSVDSDVDTGVGGGSMGYGSLSGVTCWNRTSGQRLSGISPDEEGSRWDCGAGGLTASPGDNVIMVVRGSVD
jgi:hypothetical protein